MVISTSRVSGSEPPAFPLQAAKCGSRELANRECLGRQERPRGGCEAAGAAGHPLLVRSGELTEIIAPRRCPASLLAAGGKRGTLAAHTRVGGKMCRIILCSRLGVPVLEPRHAGTVGALATGCYDLGDLAHSRLVQGWHMTSWVLWVCLVCFLLSPLWFVCASRPSIIPILPNPGLRTQLGVRGRTPQGCWGFLTSQQGMAWPLCPRSLPPPRFRLPEYMGHRGTTAPLADWSAGMRCARLKLCTGYL